MRASRKSFNFFSSLLLGFFIATVKLKKGWKLLLFSGGFWPFFVIHEPNKSEREKSGEPGWRKGGKNTTRK
jgi:hypothetical protein